MRLITLVVTSISTSFDGIELTKESIFSKKFIPFGLRGRRLQGSSNPHGPHGPFVP